jgi:hypothetical protein
VAVVAARWVRSGLGRRTVRRGSTARAPDARVATAIEGFARERFRHPATRRPATAREGARARRAEDRVAAAGTRGSARIVDGRIPRAREAASARGRGGKSDSGTSHRRRPENERAAADGAGGRWPTGRSIVDRPSIRPTVSFERAPVRDRRFAIERPGDPIKPAREIARSPRRSAGAVPATRRIRRDASRTNVAPSRERFYPSRGHAPAQTKIARPRAHAHQSPWLFVSSRARRRP